MHVLNWNKPFFGCVCMKWKNRCLSYSEMILMTDLAFLSFLLSFQSFCRFVKSFLSLFFYYYFSRTLCCLTNTWIISREFCCTQMTKLIVLTKPEEASWTLMSPLAVRTTNQKTPQLCSKLLEVSGRPKNMVALTVERTKQKGHLCSILLQRIAHWYEPDGWWKMDRQALKAYNTQA